MYTNPANNIMVINDWDTKIFLVLINSKMPSPKLFPPYIPFETENNLVINVWHADAKKDAYIEDIKQYVLT